MCPDGVTEDDFRYMGRALELAARGRDTASPNPLVGAVVVKDGRIVGEGWHERAGSPYAEVLAMQAAGEQAEGATLYVTLEPCAHFGRTPPCTDAILRAGIVEVVIASLDCNPLAAGGRKRLEADGLRVRSGILAEEEQLLNREWRRRIVEVLTGADNDV